MSDPRFGVQDAALDDLRARLQNTRWPSVVAVVPAPRQFAERFFRIVRWTELRAGGHFTAWEELEAARERTALARDVVPETSHG